MLACVVVEFVILQLFFEQCSAYNIFVCISEGKSVDFGVDGKINIEINLR